MYLLFQVKQGFLCGQNRSGILRVQFFSRVGDENLQNRRSIAARDGEIVGDTRKEIEADLGKSIIRSINAKMIKGLKEKK